ncbi:unnamed protein product [Brachionus calyciflorus]|uniref:Uncharacterized protein n=1 Tax=Brachionus calyciflorus TaxID=104777 RepID=A0A813VBI7_9BILA|nr:unnamed protein product [Brachionus calyciflorus]
MRLLVSIKKYPELSILFSISRQTRIINNFLSKEKIGALIFCDIFFLAICKIEMVIPTLKSIFLRSCMNVAKTLAVLNILYFLLERLWTILNYARKYIKFNRSYLKIVNYKKKLFYMLSTDRNDTDRLICYTLSILTYFELLMKRLNILVRNFPPDNVCLVNLDVDELLDVDTDEVTILNEVTNEPSLFELKDNYESHIEMIRTLREQVEQLDVNLGRYNVRQESSDFIGKINEFNEDKDQEQNLTNRKNSNKSTTRTPINISKNNKQIKNSKLKEICNRRKFLCTIVIIIVICVIIIAIVCGLVFGLRKT